MADVHREKRSARSYPRLERLGWDRDEPTEVMRKSLEKLDESATADEQVRDEARRCKKPQVRR